MTQTQHESPPAVSPLLGESDGGERLLVAMLEGTDLAAHGTKVAAGLARFYKYTTRQGGDLVSNSDLFGEHWVLEQTATPPLVVAKDPRRALSLHPAITARFEDPFTRSSVSGLQMLLAVALTVNPDLDAAVKVAVPTGAPLPLDPKTVRLVTMPGARKSHGMGVYLLRFNTTVNNKGTVVIGSAVTGTFKERLDGTVYSAADTVRAAASWIDQRRDRDDFVLFDLACYADSIPQLDWIALALGVLCVVMFDTSSPGRGLNASCVVASNTKEGAALKTFWDAVLSATSAGAQIWPYLPDETGPDTFEEFYRRHLAPLNFGSIGHCFDLVCTVSQLADTRDYTAFPPLPEDAFAKTRPVPRGLVGEAVPRAPPTVGIGSHVHFYQHHRDKAHSPSRRRGLSPANTRKVVGVPDWSTGRPGNGGAGE